MTSIHLSGTWIPPLPTQRASSTTPDDGELGAKEVFLFVLVGGIIGALLFFLIKMWLYPFFKRIPSANGRNQDEPIRLRPLAPGLRNEVEINEQILRRMMLPLHRN